MLRLEGKAAVAQGGGPTAVTNQSLAGVVLEARKYPFVSHVYGARFGVRGIVTEDFLDLPFKNPPRPLMGPLPQFDRLIAPPVRVVTSMVQA